MEGEQKQPAEPHSLSEPSQLLKRLKRSEEDSTVPSLVKQRSEVSTSKHYQDTTIDKNNASYCSFVSSSKKSTEPVPNNPIQQILSNVAVDFDPDDEDEQKKKIAAAKKLLFPGALATSFPEVSDTLRNERRQEFCPIYQDETPEQVALRLAKRKPIGSLLSKRIRWDDLKRKREEEEEKAQMQFRYGSYAPVYDNQSSFANPYEQYYAAVQNQYDLMVKVNEAQQEYSGFWPESQQPSYGNNEQSSQNPWQQQVQPYTYPYSYPAMNYNHMTGMYSNPPISYTSKDYDQLRYLRNMQPPPPPPDES